MKDTNQVETISISDGDKVYEFEKPDFECELHFISYDGFIQGCIVGARGKYQSMWDYDGTCFETTGEHGNPTTNPMPVQQKKEWYEDKSNFPCLMKKHKFDYWEYRSVTYKQYEGSVEFDKGWLLATKAERDSFFCLDIEDSGAKESNQ